MHNNFRIEPNDGIFANKYIGYGFGTIDVDSKGFISNLHYLGDKNITFDSEMLKPLFLPDNKIRLKVNIGFYELTRY